MLKTFYSFKLRLIAVTVLVVTIVSTGGYESAAASANVLTVLEPERQTDSADLLTSQTIIKYRATANATDSNGRIKTAQIDVISTTSGETLTYKRAMSGDAHILGLPTRMSSAAVEAIARKLAAPPPPSGPTTAA